MKCPQKIRVAYPTYLLKDFPLWQGVKNLHDLGFNAVVFSEENPDLRPAVLGAQDDRTLERIAKLISELDLKVSLHLASLLGKDPLNLNVDMLIKTNIAPALKWFLNLGGHADIISMDSHIDLSKNHSGWSGIQPEKFWITLSEILPARG